MIMTSGPKLKIHEKNKLQKPVQARKSIPNSNSSKTSYLSSPIRVIKTVKSQSNIYYPKKITIQRPKLSVSNAVQEIKIKSIEKKVKFLNDKDEPSPIVSPKKKGYFSMTEEELKELKLFLREMNK